MMELWPNILTIIVVLIAAALGVVEFRKGKLIYAIAATVIALSFTYALHKDFSYSAATTANSEL